MYKCYSGNSKTTQKLFLKLPKQLYTKEENPQDIKTEKQILNGTHVLSSEFQITPIVLTKNDKPICRCLMTYYEGDSTAYIGFFEAENNINAVKEMFVYVERKAREDGKTKLYGPFDCSIFINYRFKANKFGSTYTSEPYNKSYYVDLWEKCGFVISDKYVSNQLRKVEEKDIDLRLDRIYNRFVSKGYTFVSPTNETFEKVLEEIYQSMMKVYTEFSGFKPISQKQFFALFGKLKYVLNYEMVKVAYKDEEMKAFCVSLPNYHHLTKGNMTIRKLLKMMKIKKKPDEYVILYAGADPSALGLGSAILHNIRNVLYENQCTSITALIKEGNLTGKLYEGVYVDQFTYVLLAKNL